MKADPGLTRKTHLKRIPAPLAALVSDVAVYDMTAGFDLSLSNVTALSGVTIPEELDIDRITLLPFKFRTHDDVLAWSAALLADSPTASRLWVEAEREGWAAGYADLSNGGFYLDTARRLIILDHFGMNAEALGRSPYFRNNILINLVRALRDIWHEHRTGAFERDFAPEDVLMLERVRAADCDTVTLLAGWELRGAGYTEIWRHLIGAGDGDMALIFTRFLERDPAALFDGGALAYAFRQWYADRARVDGCDHETLESLDDLLLDADTLNPFGDRMLEIETIEALSLLPDGRCYLSGLGDTVLRDPFFAGMNDPLNQTHLFHLIHDIETVTVNNVAFRDPKLARLIFPGMDVEKTR